MKCRCWPGTASGLSLGKRICLVLGNARRIDRNSCTSLAGVPSLVNSSSVRLSFNSCLPRWMARASCMWNPSHIWPIMSMLRLATRLALACDDVGVGLHDVMGVEEAV